MSNNHPLPGYQSLCLGDNEQPSPQWLCKELIKTFGDHAESKGIKYFAKYRYTPDYSHYACTVAKDTDDTLEIIGPGLEVKVSPVFTVTSPHLGVYMTTGRLFVKEHESIERISVFYDQFALWYFPDAVLIPARFSPERDSSGESGAIITFKAPLVRTKHGAKWHIY